MTSWLTRLGLRLQRRLQVLSVVDDLQLHSQVHHVLYPILTSHFICTVSYCASRLKQLDSRDCELYPPEDNIRIYRTKKRHWHIDIYELSQNKASACQSIQASSSVSLNILHSQSC